MSTWRSDFERLLECYPSYAALADQLGVSRSRLQKVHSKAQEAGAGLKEAVIEHREQIKSEHTIARSMDATMQQALIQLRGAETIGEVQKVADRTESVLSKQRDKLCD